MSQVLPVGYVAQRDSCRATASGSRSNSRRLNTRQPARWARKACPGYALRVVLWTSDVPV